MQSAVLHDAIDLRRITPGDYSAASYSPAYAQLRALCVAGYGTVLSQRHHPGGVKSIVCRVGGTRRKRNDGESITLDPEFFQGALKDYHQWEIKWWREAIQNAVDARATTVRCEVHKQADGSVRVVCDDDGRGMDRETLVSKFLRLGASGKRGDAEAAGGFGKAKEMLLLPWLQWSVTTRDTRVVGRGLAYKSETIRERKGTRLEVVMPADNTTSLALAEEFISRCNLPRVKFLLRKTDADGTDGGEYEFAADTKPGKLIREVPGKAKIYFDKGRGTDLWVRTGGLWMFSNWITSEVKGRVVVELHGRSIDLLTANRDGFRDNALYRAIQLFSQELAADTKSATREKDKHRKVYRGTGKFSAVPAKELEASLAAASASAMELARKVTTGSGSVQLDEKTVEQLSDVMLHDGGAGEASVEQGGLHVGAIPAAVAAIVLTATPVLGQEHVERILKQMAWQPDFYVANNHDVWKPPPGMLPERMNKKTLALAKVWTELCRYTLISLGSNAEFGVGWVFDPSMGAGYLREQGQHWLMLNPLSNKSDLSEVFDPRKPEALNWLTACAIHEATHMADGIDLHNEAFSSALTTNIARCAGMFAIAPALVEAIFGGATIQQARATALRLGGAAGAVAAETATKRARVAERIVEREVERIVERPVIIREALSPWEQPIPSAAGRERLELVSPRARTRFQQQLGLKLNRRRGR